MTIEIEEQNDRVTILSIKGAREGPFPAGYARRKAASFRAFTNDYRTQLISTTETLSGRFRDHDRILQEGDSYDKKAFDIRLAFIKAAGKRLTEINREARKPKRRTITI